jgi:hypothetical protein
MYGAFSTEILHGCPLPSPNDASSGNHRTHSATAAFSTVGQSELVLKKQLSH